jgi:RNA binding exosome subunit
MRKCILLFVVALATACGVSAQEANVVFHPGDQIHILVTFKAAPASPEGGTFTFALEGQPDKAQELLNRGLYGNQIHKVSETQYEITGTIPEHVVSGHYGNELTITVINPEHPDFPAINDVKLSQK